MCLPVYNLSKDTYPELINFEGGRTVIETGSSHSLLVTTTRP